MEWDTTSIALVISSLVALAGILPQVVQSIAYSKSDKKRVETEAQNASSQGMAQFAGAAQTLQSANVTLINELQEETHSTRERNAVLIKMLDRCQRNHLTEHLQGKKLVTELTILYSKFCKDCEDPLAKELMTIITKYEPIFSNGIHDNENGVG